MEPRVRIAHGTAFDVVLAAAAVADPVWRDTFEAGQRSFAQVVSSAGDDLVRRAARFGRFGWINLIGLMGFDPEPWDLSRLIGAVETATAEDLHLSVIGGNRRQLLELIDEPTLRSALRGPGTARDTLAAAGDSQRLVIESAPWLLDTPSEKVQETLLAVLRDWRDLVLPAAAERELASTLREQASAARAVLADTSGRGFLETAIGGLHYDPAGLDLVVSVSTPQVAPIVVVVDGSRYTTIVHPPVGPSRGDDHDARLLELGRAVGDRTRMQLLSLLRGGERTAVELANGMRSPRTTLLHHLAILRAAGLIDVNVTRGGATIYRLRPEAFAELSGAAQAFVGEVPRIPAG